MTIFLFLCQYLVLFVTINASKLSDALTADKIIPDLLRHPPKRVVFVKYPNGDVVSLGNELMPYRLSLSPKVVWEAPPATRYTLVMLDIDMPKHESPSMSPYLHWLVVNIPGKRLRYGLQLASYLLPRPQKDSGLHRYVFLLYQQAEAHQFVQFWENGDERDNFNINEFSAMYGMGNPIAVNYFMGQYH